MDNVLIKLIALLSYFSLRFDGQLLIIVKFAMVGSTGCGKPLGQMQVR